MTLPSHLKNLWLTGKLHFNALQKNKKIFFASDFHFGAQHEEATSKEEKIITWLSHIRGEACALFLLGDIFDFGVSYQHVIPKRFINFQNKILKFKALSIPVFCFVGNRDLWATHYFTHDLGMSVFHKVASFEIGDKKFLMGHGDTINMSQSYCILSTLYKTRIFKWMLQCIHPDIMIPLVRMLLKKGHQSTEELLLTNEIDRIFKFCKEKIAPYAHHDFYVFGHTHYPHYSPINSISHYCNVGDWVHHCTYGVFDGVTLKLLSY